MSDWEFYDLIIERRSIRKFHQRKIPRIHLYDCINAARLAPSSGNLQPLEYIIVTENLEKVFTCLKWAAYLEDGVPEEGERPTAYIIVLSNTKINNNARYDVGLAVENILLTALERGIASCIIGNINRIELRPNLSIPDDYAIELVIALGYPKQISKEIEFKNTVKYYIDCEDILNVPKKKLNTILHEEKFC